ncbi:MAG: hypothetical protein KME29_05035 [Calothrix sp. FI2-JRJ7]|jgi:hypothetical protein|nr:hypothetical protein [Calothrix sp. FI2-JRJ7]
MAPITSEELFWLAQSNECVNSSDLAALVRLLRQVRGAAKFASSLDTIIVLRNVDFDVSSAIREKLCCRMPLILNSECVAALPTK